MTEKLTRTKRTTECWYWKGKKGVKHKDLAKIEEGKFLIWRPTSSFTGHKARVFKV